MITTIAKNFTFDAAHFLPTVPEHHKCRRMHGHTYGVTLMFTGRTDRAGFCAGIDYGDIASVWERIHRQIDHRTLNDVPGLEVPTTENLVPWLANEFAAQCGLEHAKLRLHLSKIRVAESASTWCELELTQSWRSPSGRR